MPDHGLINSGHVRVGLSSHATDTDGVGLARDATNVGSNINVVRAGRKVCTGKKTQGDIVAASAVARKRVQTGGRVVAAGAVARKRVLAGGRVEKAVTVANERVLACGRVPDAGAV